MNRAVEAVTPEKLSQLARTVTGLNNAKLFASWQSGPETLSGFPQWKLRLELAAVSPWGNHGGKTPRKTWIARGCKTDSPRVEVTHEEGEES
jgi:hypothetical protein